MTTCGFCDVAALSRYTSGTSSYTVRRSVGKSARTRSASNPVVTAASVCGSVAGMAFWERVRGGKDERERELHRANSPIPPFSLSQSVVFFEAPGDACVELVAERVDLHLIEEVAHEGPEQRDAGAPL